jgi:hypothetical protein
MTDSAVADLKQRVGGSKTASASPSGNHAGL